MNFERPIVFFDLETTGTDVNNDRIVQIAMVKLNRELSRDIGVDNQLINPEIPIPAGSIEVHHITDEMVADKPVFKEHANTILEFINGCDIAGYNCLRFDIPLLYNEFQRAGIDWDWKRHKIIDVCSIFMQHEKRDLQSAVRFYCGKEFGDAHNALNDVEATIDVFKAQTERYTDLPQTPEELEIYCNHGKEILDLSGKFRYNDEGEIIFTFGQYRNEPAKEHGDYLYWMLGKNFPADTVDVIHQILEDMNEDNKNEDVPFE